MWGHAICMVNARDNGKTFGPGWWSGSYSQLGLLPSALSLGVLASVLRPHN